MTTRHRDARRGGRFGGLFGLLALLVTWAAVWRHDPGVGRDLFPSPDAPEYFAGAARLHDDGDYSIRIAGQRLPLRYPPGFSTAMRPFLGLVEEPVDAPFAANGSAALLLLLVVFGALWFAGERLAAGLATLLIATTPMFLVLARSPMSDLLGMLLTTVALVPAVRYGLGGRPWLGAASAALLGLSAIVRLGNLLLVPALVVAWLVHGERDPRRLARHGGVLLLCGCAGLLPLLLYRHHTFGDVFASGYSVWVPDRAGLLQAFGVENVVANLRNLLREVAQMEWKTTLASHYGHASYFGPASVIACLGAAVLVRPRRRELALGLGIAAYGAAMTCYFWADARFYAPLLPPCAMFVALRMARVRGAAGRLTIGGLLACHVLGVPGSGAIADVPRYLFEQPPRAAPQFELVRALRGRDPGLVLCAFNPVYCQALLGDAWTVAPANDDHDYRFHPQYFHFAAEQRRQLVQRALADGAPVYLLDDGDFAARRATLGEFGEWQVLDVAGAAVLVR